MNYRISKLREYLLSVIDEMTQNRKYQINANMLSNKVDDYSLDKIPTTPNVEGWIIGVNKKKDVFSLRSRKSYSQDAIDNLKNIGFFEEFEKKIKYNNKNGILPNITNIESIECLNCGTMLSNDDMNSAIFDIQIQITYIDDDEEYISL